MLFIRIIISVAKFSGRQNEVTWEMLPKTWHWTLLALLFLGSYVTDFPYLFWRNYSPLMLESKLHWPSRTHCHHILCQMVCVFLTWSSRISDFGFKLLDWIKGKCILWFLSFQGLLYFHKPCSKVIIFLLSFPNLSSKQSTKFAFNSDKNRYQLQILFMSPFLLEEK